MKKLLTTLIVSAIACIGFSDDMPPEVKRLKTIRDKKVEEIDTVYNRELEKLKKKYAANGNYKAIAYIENMQTSTIDSAKTENNKTTALSQNEKGSLSFDSGAYARIYCKDEFGKFENGGQYFFDHDTRMANIPDGYDEFYISLSSAFDTEVEKLSFKVKKAGIVLLAVTLPLKGKMIDDGWKEIDKFVRTGANGSADVKGKFFLMQKELPEGEYEFPITHHFSAPCRILRPR